MAVQENELKKKASSKSKQFSNMLPNYTKVLNDLESKKTNNK